MQRVFQIIKKKKNLRLTSVLLLVLVTIELFSHPHNGVQTLAAELSSMTAEITISNETKGDMNETTVTISDNKNQNPDRQFCNDETLHHDVLISILSYPVKKAFFRSERIVFYSGEPVHKSLPPPYLPPKNS